MMTAPRRLMSRPFSRLLSTCSVIGLCCSAVNSANLDQAWGASSASPDTENVGFEVAAADSHSTVVGARSWQEAFAGSWR